MIRRGLVFAAVFGLVAAGVGASFAQEAAPLPESAAAAPVVDLDYTEQERAVAARVVEEAVSEKIRQVNEAMDAGDAGEAPAAAVVETPGREWTPVENSMRALFGLLVVLGLLFVLAYLVKRFGKNSGLLGGGDLGRVMGKVYLSPRASLHFVRTGGKVLVVGVTPNAISMIAEFDADVFGAGADEPGRAGVGGGASETESFLAQFKASLESIARTAPSDAAGEDGAEIASLREDVQRLQQYLQETVRGGDNP